MSTTGRWFRFYDSVVDDPKVQRLPAPLFRAWVNIMCLASRNAGKLPSTEDMLFSMRMSERQLSEIIGKLVDAGLLDQVDEDVTPHNWSGRQFQSDVSTDRVKRFRERSTKQPETVSRNTPETETETETQVRGEKELSSLRSDKPRNAKSNLPENFPDQNSKDWAISHWVSLNRADLCASVEAESAKFRDHHTSNATRSADWAASFRTWAQNAPKWNKQHLNGANGHGKPSANDKFLAGGTRYLESIGAIPMRASEGEGD